MTDDKDPVIVGDAIPPADMDVGIDMIDILDAIDLWDEIASPLYVGALDWNAEVIQ